ncbi:MAG: Crp/Fnr family transcriptional regulator [Nitrospiraceae bacterium]|nr:MAG: Crp/Fnr family transcriptional regulator [Nitrospiraceae bacterium]
MSTVSPIITELRTLPCLSALKEEELYSLGGHSHTKKFQKNDTLFLEDDPVHSLFVVKTGRIKLFKTSFNGKELIIKIMRPDEYFCCAPVYCDKVHPVSAAALEDSEILVIPVKDFKAMLNSSVSETGLRIISGLCSRIKYLSGLLEDISFKDVEHRILMLLLRLAEEKAPEADIVLLTITHQDIAAMTGTVRVVVSRTMSKLKKEKIIVDSTIKGFTLDKARLSRHISHFERPV